MKKKVVVGAALMMMPLVSFAGGYLTNTNQHAAFLRSLSRGAAIDIDGTFAGNRKNMSEVFILSLFSVV